MDTRGKHNRNAKKRRAQDYKKKKYKSESERLLVKDKGKKKKSQSVQASNSEDEYVPTSYFAASPTDYGRLVAGEPLEEGERLTFPPAQPEVVRANQAVASRPPSPRRDETESVHELEPQLEGEKIRKGEESSVSRPVVPPRPTSGAGGGKKFRGNAWGKSNRGTTKGKDLLKAFGDMASQIGGASDARRDAQAWAREENRCYQCGGLGHMARNCPSDPSRVQLGRSDEEEVEIDVEEQEEEKEEEIAVENYIANYDFSHWRCRYRDTVCYVPNPMPFLVLSFIYLCAFWAFPLIEVRPMNNAWFVWSYLPWILSWIAWPIPGVTVPPEWYEVISRPNLWIWNMTWSYLLVRSLISLLPVAVFWYAMRLSKINFFTKLERIVKWKTLAREQVEYDHEEKDLRPEASQVTDLKYKNPQIWLVRRYEQPMFWLILHHFVSKILWVLPHGIHQKVSPMMAESKYAVTGEAYISFEFASHLMTLRIMDPSQDVVTMRERLMAAAKSEYVVNENRYAALFPGLHVASNTVEVVAGVFVASQQRINKGFLGPRY